MTRVALVEPYLGGSHQYWAEGYAAHSPLDVEVFGLPAVHWKWRMQGGHVTLAPRIIEAAAARGPFDAVIASDMTNLAGLLGLLRQSAGDIASVLYMHENQLTFPRPAHDDEDLTYAAINWTSMLAADTIVFNSAYHRDDWFGALPGFLRRMPDHRHTGLIDAARRRSVVVPVGLDLAAIDGVPRDARPRPLLLWNQRWQWDKGPDLFVALVEQLLARGLDVDIAVAGECGLDRTDRDRLVEVGGDRLVHDGHAARGDYLRLLRSADIVVSTARHEFLGIAILEAMRAGAMPVVPNRLVYPEHIPEEVRGRCLYDDSDGLLAAVEWAATHRSEANEIAEQVRSVTDRFAWPTVANDYDNLVT